MMSDSNERPGARALAEQVAMLCVGDEVYGIGTVLKLYAQALPALTFVAFRDGPMVEWLRNNGSRVEIVLETVRVWDGGPSLWTLVQMPRVLMRARREAASVDSLLRGRGIRIIHAHWRLHQIMAGFLRQRGYKSVWHIHNNMNPKRLLGVGRKLNHAMASWAADLLLPVSDFIGENWKGCGVPMATIRNAAVPIYRELNDLPERPIRCLIAGRLDHSKGHHLAVEAVIRARQAGLDVRLDIYGGPLEDNPYADRLRERITSSGCAESIRLLGFQTDMRQRHQQYHLGLQCRIDPEPCSVWVCETLVDGLPLVASASGGTPELVEHGKTGILFRSGDVEDLTKKLIELASAPARLREMRASAFERGKRFTRDQFSSQTLRAYESLLPPAALSKSGAPVSEAVPT